MLIISIIVLQAVPGLFSADLVLEGNLKLGPHFLRTLKDISRTIRISKPVVPIGSKGKQFKFNLGKIYKRASDINKTEEEETNYKPGTTVKPVPPGYIIRMKKKGTSTIKSIGKLLTKELPGNITLNIDAIANEYVTMVQKYYNYVSAEKTNTEIDKEYLYFDIIEMSNKLIYSQGRKLLNDILKDNNATKSIGAMNEKIYKLSIKTKQEEFRYVCYEYEVCRQFPTFTDYCADFMSEILKLNDKKFLQFLDLVPKYVKSNQELLESVSEKKDRDIMVSKLNTFYKDLYSMREFFAVFRAVITQRYKVLQSDKEELKNRTKAMRILLDIIDLALGKEDEVLSIDFSNTMAAFREWSGGSRKDIDDVFGTFVTNIFKLFDQSLSKNARQEISVLIELIMRGSTQREATHQRLFKYGSKFVKGDDFVPVMDGF